MYYVFVDTETGGLSPDIHSLLQVAFLLTDENFNLIEELHLYTKPDNGNYVLTKKAVELNGFNISDHEKVAVNYTQMKKIIRSFLDKYGGPFQIVGWNVHFDIGFLSKYIELRYRFIDVMSLYLSLKLVNVIESEGNSLVSAAKYFQYNTHDAHNALIDASLTRSVFCDIIDILKRLENVY